MGEVRQRGGDGQAKGSPASNDLPRRRGWLGEEGDSSEQGRREPGEKMRRAREERAEEKGKRKIEKKGEKEKRKKGKKRKKKRRGGKKKEDGSWRWLNKI